MANLEGRGSSGKFEPHFNGENESEREKFLGGLSMRQKLFKTAKNPTGHIDTLSIFDILSFQAVLISGQIY